MIDLIAEALCILTRLFAASRDFSLRITASGLHRLESNNLLAVSRKS